MSHVTYEWDMPHINELCHIWMSHVTYEWAMSQTQMTKEPQRPCDWDFWVMSHMIFVVVNKAYDIWMSHVTYEWVTSHEWVMLRTHTTTERRGLSVIETWRCVTHEWVMSHVDESLHMCESCLKWVSHVTYEWVTSHFWVTSHMNVSCHAWMSHYTHRGVVSRVNKSWHIWISSVLQCVAMCCLESSSQSTSIVTFGSLT